MTLFGIALVLGGATVLFLLRDELGLRPRRPARAGPGRSTAAARRPAPGARPGATTSGTTQTTLRRDPPSAVVGRARVTGTASPS